MRMHKMYIGIDNGVTGSIATVGFCRNSMIHTPVFKEQSYTKAKAQITRVNHLILFEILEQIVHDFDQCSPLVILERPFVNPKGFKASVSALRALESTLIVIERLDLPYQYIDSKEWQRIMLPKGTKGTADLKSASKDIGLRLFPELREAIEKQKDADSLLMAEWARRSRL